MKALTHAAGEFFCGNGRLGRGQLPQKMDDLLCELMWFLGTTFMRQKPFQSLLLELLLGLVDRRTRQAELTGRFGDGIAIFVQRPERFVFKLEQIFRIKEVRVLKQSVPDLSGARIECSGSAEGLTFG